MATLTATTQLVAGHAPEDLLELRVGSGDRLTLAESTPAGGRVVATQPIGPAANDEPPASRTLSAAVTPPPGSGGCAVLAVGITVKDQAGNVSPLYETFDLVADHPAGVTPAPGTPEPTANPNEALLTWTPSPSL